MAEITVVETPVAGAEVAPSANEVLVAEAAPVVAEAAVAVAEVEAERDVTIAEIHAETEQAAIETAATVAAEQRTDSEWQRNIETRLSVQETTNQEILSTLATLAERLPSPQAELESPAVTPESQEAPEPPAPKRKAHHRLI